MSAWQRTLDYFDGHGLDLWADIWWHAQSGGLIVLPHLVAMARPVSSSWTAAEICDPSCNVGTSPTLRGPADCWHVHWCCGPIHDALTHLPYSLPLVSYQRSARGDHRVRIVRLARFLQRSSHEQVQTMSAGGSSSPPPVKAPVRDMSAENQERARQETLLLQRRRQGLAATNLAGATVEEQQRRASLG